MRRAWRRAILLGAGVMLGFLLILVVGYIYFRAASDSQLAERLRQTIDLPPSAFTLARLESDSLARVTLRNVAVLDSTGDTIVAAPSASLRIHLTSLSGDGPIELSQVVLTRPYLNLVQDRGGNLNLMGAVALTADGNEVEAPESGKGVLLRDVRIDDGRARIATPWSPDSVPIRPEKRAEVMLAGEGGSTMRIRSARDVNARIALIRIGGPDGWRADVASLTARLTDPEVQILALSGSAGQTAGGARFTLDELRTERSMISGGGEIDFGGPTLVYDVNIQASPVDFADLEWLVPSLPAGGQVRGGFAFVSQPDNRVEIRGDSIVASALDSRITGDFAALVGGGQPISFRDTRISLDPLEIETLRTLGVGPDLPYTGQIRGVITSPTDSTAADALQVNLTANFTPLDSTTTAPDGAAAPSIIRFQGPVALGAPDSFVRFQGARVSLEPLRMAALRPLAPDQAARLRGVLNGTFLLNGTLKAPQIPEGDITYNVGDAPTSHLAGITLQLTLDPELRFDLRARADPLALGTLAELFGLPFRTALFTGPVSIAGNADQIRVNTELTGSPGRFTLGGTVSPGTPLRFDLSGQVAALRPEAVLSRSVAVAGPITGSFGASGTTEDLRFNMDLAQDTGSFVVRGSMTRGPAGAAVQVAGSVSDFNLGSLVGRPRLFPSRMTGNLQLAGGASQPYAFTVDLVGPAGGMALRGSYDAGPVPAYSLSGSVTGIDLQQFPGAGNLPATRLTGTIDMEGRGTTTETLAGRLSVDASGSTIQGTPASSLRADLVVRDGVLTVSEFDAALNETELTASGTLGLTRPVSSPLTYRLVSSDLSRLTPFVPETAGGAKAQLNGSLVMQGWVSGSLQNPTVAAGFRGQNLRYNDWRAALLEFDTELQLADIQNPSGNLTLFSRELNVSPTVALDSVRLALSGGGSRVGVKLAAHRAEGSSVRLTGLVELDGRVPRAITLDSLLVRSRTVAWQLVNPAVARWGGPEGLTVNNLLLERLGGEAGTVLVNGSIPRTGDADFQMTVRELDLDIIHDLLPSAPAMGGVLNLDATLAGPVDDPQVTVRATARNVLFEGARADSLLVTARYDQRRLNGSVVGWRAETRMISGDASVPMHLALENIIPHVDLLREDSASARIVADSLPLILVELAVPTVEDVEGFASSEMTLSGSIDQPNLNGWAVLSDGAATLPALGAHYDRITGRLTLDNQLVRVDSLRVWSDGDALVNGTIRIPDLDRPELALTAELDGFKAIQNNDVADLTISGDLALSGAFPNPVLTGNLELREGVIFIPSLNARTPLDIGGLPVAQIETDTAIAARVGPPSILSQVQIQELDVTVTEGVWLQSEDARVEIRGDLVVFRSGEMPRIYGTLQAVRGTYALTIGPLVREFEISAGSVRFFGTPDFNPDLDITAEHEVRVSGLTNGGSALTVLVHVSGTLEYPRVELSSNTRPPLPESELLNYLVFGQPTFQLAAQRVGGLAQQILVQELVGGILVQELGHLGLPCQYFRLRGRPDLVSTLSVNPVSAFSSTSVECGMQLATDLFLTLETGPIFGGSNFLFGSLASVSMDWQINDHMTTRMAREPVQATARSMILTPVEIPYQWSLDLRGTWEFGKPKTEAPLAPEMPQPQIEN